MGVKVIVYYEEGWLPPVTDWRYWDHLCRAYGADLQMINAWDEAVVPDGYSVCAVDEAGVTEIKNYAPPTDVVYVLGNSTSSPLLLLGASADDSIRVDTPEDVCPFPISIGGILLHFLHG